MTGSGEPMTTDACSTVTESMRTDTTTVPPGGAVSGWQLTVTDTGFALGTSYVGGVKRQPWPACRLVTASSTAASAA